MRVLIAGVDGYLGWPFAQYLAERDHDVAGIDCFLRREWVEEMGSCSAIPVYTFAERLKAFERRYGRPLSFWNGDLTDYDLVHGAIAEFEPDAIVHLGECPSGPYSMMDSQHAVWVQTNNIVSTLNLLFAMRDVRPEAHLLKLGTMGEYGTPGVPIPEGFFDVEYRGRKDHMPFPRQAGSFYHWSKVHGSNVIMFGCKIWGLRATDVMQGVVFGTRASDSDGDPRLHTRLDFDQAFGTVINRFCCQAAIGRPLTPYGAGHQRRGFLPLRDSMQCLTLALENPPRQGEYRVFNQFEEIYEITELALIVQRVAERLGLPTEIRNVENPREELEDHFYEADHQHLFDLGYTPTRDLEGEIEATLSDLLEHRERIVSRADALLPDVHWDGTRRPVRFVGNRRFVRVPVRASARAVDL